MGQRSWAVRSISPPSPNEGSGSPVTVSIEMSRQRLFRKTRRSPASFSQSATPRWTNPVPFGTCPHSVIRGS